MNHCWMENGVKVEGPIWTNMLVIYYISYSY